MCIDTAILRLKSINNKSIEAFELCKIPRDIWERVALTEIIPRTDFGRGDVVQQNLFFLGRGQEITGETLFLSHFYISHSQHCLKIYVSCC